MPAFRAFSLGTHPNNGKGIVCGGGRKSQYLPERGTRKRVASKGHLFLKGGKVSGVTANLTKRHGGCHLLEHTERKLLP